MAARLGRAASAYLDANVTVWLAQGDLHRLTNTARECVESAELLLSPVVLLELEYLYEIKRILLSAQNLLLKLEYELGVHVCDLEFPRVIAVALNEKWTRDPFDRVVVAHAKTNGLALISADEEIKRHYPKTVW